MYSTLYPVPYGSWQPYQPVIYYPVAPMPQRFVFEHKPHHPIPTPKRMPAEPAMAQQTRQVAEDQPVWKKKMKEYGVLIGVSILMTGIKVLMHGKAYQAEGFSATARRLLHIQELVRQSVSTIIWLATLCMSYEYVVKKHFPNMSNGQQVVLSSVLSQIPDTFVRPFVTARVSRYLLGHHFGKIGIPFAGKTPFRPNAGTAPQQAPRVGVTEAR
jgi:hypothetical protein